MAALGPSGRVVDEIKVDVLGAQASKRLVSVVGTSPCVLVVPDFRGDVDGRARQGGIAQGVLGSVEKAASRGGLNAKYTPTSPSFS